MRIVIGGGSGFIGQHLCRHLEARHDEVDIISSSPVEAQKRFTHPKKIYSWNELSAESLKKYDLIINLAGANIGEKRWTAKRKKEIVDSRVETTRQLVALCCELDSPPRLFNTSAIGVYGLQALEVTLPPPFDENTPIDFNKYPDFLSEVARRWEKATWPLKEKGGSVVNMRFAVVMDRSGGVFKKLALPFYVGLGGSMDSGNQPFSWVGLDDLLRAIDFLIAHPEITGPVNIVSPRCLQQKEAAKIIGKILHRPSKIKTPNFILKLAFGQMAEELLLQGQHVKPTRLLQAGFQFTQADLKDAL